MGKKVMHILLILVTIFCFNSTNVYAQDTSIDFDNTEAKEVTNNTIEQEKNDTNSNLLNNPSDATSEENTDENNDEILTLDELNKLDDKLEFTEEVLTVKGNLFDYTNTTLIKEIINKSEIINKYNLIIQIVDKSNNIIAEDIIINDEIYFVLKNDTLEMKFKITFLFDFDGNYIVNEEDKVKLLELMAEDSTIIESENLSYFDYVLKNKTYVVPERGEISLDMEITTDKDHYDYEDEFDVIITNPQPPVEILTLDELNKLDDKLEFTEGILTVKGNLFDYTNTTLIKEIINKSEIISKYNLIMQFMDKSNNIIAEDIIINDEIYLVLKNDTLEMKFKITFLFDFDENYIVNEEDKAKLLELMAEDSTIIESENLSYFDYVLKNKTYVVPEREDTSIDTEITTENNDPVTGDNQSSSTNVEENLEDNPEKNPSEEEILSEDDEEYKKIYINVISGKIDYDHEALKLLSINFDVYKNLSTEEDSYLFWVDNLETIKIALRFKVINQNSREYITIYDSDICSEGKEIETEKMRAKVILNKIPEPVPPKEENKVDKPSKTEEQKVIRKKRTDSYASKINIKNHLIKFDYLIKNYTIKADYSETSLDFDVILRDKKYATYTITGNNNFKVGENLVVVTVTAEDGSTTDYKFNVIRMDKNIIHDEKTNNIGYDLLSMNIFLGVLIVAIGIIYKLISYKLNRY